MSAPAKKGAGKATKSAKAETAPLGKPTFRRTEFTKRVEDAIRSEPALMRAASSHDIAKRSAAKYETELEANRLKDIDRWKSSGMQFQVPSYMAGPTQIRVAIAKEIGMSDADIKSMGTMKLDKFLKDWHVNTIDKFINNPNAQPANRIEAGYAMYASNLLREHYKKSAEMSERLSMGLSSSARLDIKEIIGAQNYPPWEKALMQFPSKLSRLPRNEPLKWDEGIDAEYEAASTRVGAIVRDEYKSRITARIDEARSRIDEQVKSIKSALVTHISNELGMEIKPAWVTMSNWADGKRLTVTLYIPAVDGRERYERLFGDSGRSDSVTPLPSDLVKMIKDSGLETLDFGSEFNKAAIQIGEQTFIEVMQEIRPMGGVFADTPNHRKTQFGMSTNQQLTAIAQKYPSDWIDASNVFGQVKYALTSSRQHYNHSRTSEPAEVTLDKADLSTGVHEMGHRMEATVWGLSALEKVFFERRTQGEQAESLRKLDPGQKYDSSERAKPDKFFHPYSGKVYGDGFYEVFTMGIEEIAMRKGRKSANGTIDDDYMAFMFGALATIYREPL